jgi:hypothetical protein
VIEGGAAGIGRVGRAAMMLGFAGLLPSIASVGVLALVPSVTTWNWVVPVAAAAIVAVVYPLLILSFLGGIWWGLAMRRGAGQGRLAAIAVLPSLMALVLGGLMLVTGRVGWPLVVIGSTIALTLIVDRHLVAVGDAPAGWMRLRVPLSLGLGGLTILAGMLAGSAGLPS